MLYVFFLIIILKNVNTKLLFEKTIYLFCLHFQKMKNKINHLRVCHVLKCDFLLNVKGGAYWYMFQNRIYCILSQKNKRYICIFYLKNNVIYQLINIRKYICLLTLCHVYRNSYFNNEKGFPKVTTKTYTMCTNSV